MAHFSALACENAGTKSAWEHGEALARRWLALLDQARVSQEELDSLVLGFRRCHPSSSVSVWLWRGVQEWAERLGLNVPAEETWRTWEPPASERA
jgi:hypothetical protein